MRPCCANPRLHPVGVSACDAPGIVAIAWFQCLTCKAQVPQFILPGQTSESVQPPKMDEPERPEGLPRCCGRDMMWDGIESYTRDDVRQSETKWHCPFCRRTLRIPRG